MHSWAAPPLPRLPGEGPPVQVHDTAAGRLVTVDPPGQTRLYVCGITPYDATHLGHAATYVAFDLLHRAWRDRGLQVHYVQNVTDVDDPLLERAAATGEDWRELARRETQRFRDDMAALRVLPPEHYVGAVEAIPWIVTLIEQLAAVGAAYDVDGDVYFSAAAAPHFGTLGHLPAAQMTELSRERGGDPDRPGKKDPLDPLLWQAARPGEPSWDSPFGPGRPGWHVECTAIAMHLLGDRLDVLGGGSDLVFPHHELGAAEASVATGCWPYATAYVHAGMLAYAGEKMSKSRGNLVFVSDLRGRTDPMAVRLALLAHHYRSDWEWAEADLGTAEQRLARWRAAFARPAAPAAGPVVAALRAALSRDLDAPAALAAVDDWAAAAGSDPAAPAAVASAADALLGVG